MIHKLIPNSRRSVSVLSPSQESPEGWQGGKQVYPPLLGKEAQSILFKPQRIVWPQLNLGHSHTIYYSWPLEEVGMPIRKLRLTEVRRWGHSLLITLLASKQAFKYRSYSPNCCCCFLCYSSAHVKTHQWGPLLLNKVQTPQPRILNLP